MLERELNGAESDQTLPATSFRRTPFDDRAKEFQWLAQNSARFQAEWVALHGKRLLGYNEEFERADDEIGRLLKKGYDNLSIEERRLLALLSRLVEDYEGRTFPIPDSPPHRTLQFLMEQNDLRQADLAPVFGSRGRVSEVVNGKRAIYKAQAKALGEFFKISPELFI